MGTRAITNVVDEKGNVYVSLYRQYDGYPLGGHGEELAEWLEGAVIGNGIQGGERRPKFFNGIGDLACRMVAFFKGDYSDYGGFYLLPHGDDGWGGDYVYTVQARNPIYSIADGKEPETTVTVKVESWDTLLFEGSVEDFRVWIIEDSEDEG